MEPTTTTLREEAITTTMEVLLGRDEETTMRSLGDEAGKEGEFVFTSLPPGREHETTFFRLCMIYFCFKNVIIV